MEEKDLQALHDDLKGFLAAAAEQKQLLGTVRDETKAKIDALTAKGEAMQNQLDGIDKALQTRTFPEPDVKTLSQQFVESEEFKAAQAKQFVDMRSKDGRIRVPIPDIFMGHKTVIYPTAGLTSGTTGVYMPMRLPGVTGLPMQELRIRDLLTVVQMTSGNSFDYVRTLSRSNAASPQLESSPKAESTYTWESKSDTVKTIAHYVNVSRQTLDDIPWMRQMLDDELMYGLLLKEESEILAGDGTGQHIKGLITQATAYNTALDVSGDTKLDKIRHAKLQARLIGLGTFAPDGVVLNPTDMAKIELIKDEAGGANKGRYIVGDPQQGTQVKFLWGLPVVESDSIAAGTFLVGAFKTGAQLIDRMQAMVEISYEHSVNFTSNIATLLAEERIGLAVRRPDAFVTGSI